MRFLPVLLAACFLLDGCSTRALRAPEDLWSGDAAPDAAAFLGYHGPVDAERPVLSGRAGS